MTDDVDDLFVDPPGRPLLKAPPYLAERVWNKLQEERRQKKRKRIVQYVRYTSLTAGAATISVAAYLWTPLMQELAPVAVNKPPASAPAASSASATPAAVPVTTPTVQPKTPKREAAEVAGHRAPVKKGFEPPKIVSAPGAIVPETTETFPAPPPRVRPYRPNVEWAVERTGSDGQPINPPQRPMGYYRKGLPRTTPAPPPGTPRIHEDITVTAPPATTTEPAPPQPTTTQPPAEREPPAGLRR